MSDIALIHVDEVFSEIRAVVTLDMVSEMFALSLMAIVCRGCGACVGLFERHAIELLVVCF